MAKFAKSAERPPDLGTYVALTGDVVGSRALTDREAVFGRLRAVFDRLNRLPEPPPGRLAFTVGDEFQGLFADATMLVDAIIDLTEAVFPHRLRFGAGWGPIVTPLRPMEVGQMDGPCFHRAREALRMAKDVNLWVVFRGFTDQADTLLSSQFALMSAVRNRWTDRQAEFVRAVRRSMNQKQVAASFKVSPSVVSESLKAADFQQLAELEAAVKEHLQVTIARLNQVAALQAQEAAVRAQRTDVLRQVEQVLQQRLQLRSAAQDLNNKLNPQRNQLDDHHRRLQSEVSRRVRQALSEPAGDAEPNQLTARIQSELREIATLSALLQDLLAGHRVEMQAVETRTREVEARTRELASLPERLTELAEGRD